MTRGPESISTRSNWPAGLSLGGGGRDGHEDHHVSDEKASRAGASVMTRRLDWLYGEVDWKRERGVLHVAAIDAATGRVLIPGALAPQSEIDRFVLGVARARCDAIVTTGAILRSEPDLRHVAGESAAEDAALRAWRHAELGLERAPALIVLSASGDFPLAHPALAAARSGLILTTARGARRLPARVAALRVCVGDPQASPIEAAIRAARQDEAAQTIAIEAGPSAAAPLYREPASGKDASGCEFDCDELLLSRFEGRVDSRALGPAFVEPDAIERTFGAGVHATSFEGASGTWQFERWRRGRALTARD